MQKTISELQNDINELNKTLKVLSKYGPSLANEETTQKIKATIAVAEAQIKEKLSEQAVYSATISFRLGKDCCI
jgi:hypothetical protein